MPRRPRKNIIAPNTIYHIVCRGNAEKKIFRRKRDYATLLKIIGKAKFKYPFYFYFYNFLPNHYHFGIEMQTISISKIMHQINNSFAKYFRRNYGSSGHVFQGRFFSQVVDKERYLWELARYIDLNAPRAGLVENPEDYPWSSFSLYCQRNYQDSLVDRERFLRHSGKDLETARISYLKFVKEGLRSKRKPSFPLDKKMV